MVYLLDVVTPYTPTPLLRSKFSHILTNIAPALTLPEADAPLLRPSIGCLETLLVAQDSTAWDISQTQIGPRKAVAGLLNLAVDHRPKIRKRALEAITKILQNPPPSPSLDHPAADMCAETALQGLSDISLQSGRTKQARKDDSHEVTSARIHALKLVKTVAKACGGWPSKKMEGLCEHLLDISKLSNEFMTMASFEVFEVVFEGMADNTASSKLPRLMEVISELRPSQNDAQLLPPWIAVLSRGYDVAAQVEPKETFQKLPDMFNLITSFMSSSSHNIRVSASECLISFMANCVPVSVLLQPSIFDEKVLESLGKAAVELLSVKYQAAWMETFNVIAAMFDGLRWQADPILVEVVRTVGDLRSHDSFTGNKEADEVIGKAIRAMGPESVLRVLPLNLAKRKAGQPGRAWMLPILRDYVSNTSLNHFKSEFVPLGEVMYKKVIEHGEAEKTMDIKIYETLVQQIWALLPGYCNLPLDLPQSFDQPFAEMLAEILYKQAGLRPDVCKAVQNLVGSNKAVVAIEEDEDLVAQNRISKAQAQQNIDHLAGFASNMLAVLFNVYSQSLPSFRGYILPCINAYLSITSPTELGGTFDRVATALASSLAEAEGQSQTDKQKQKQGSNNAMPPMSNTLMDIVITMAMYLPRESFGALFNMASLIIVQNDDAQLQKKAYKLIPRLAESTTGKIALEEQNSELQTLLLSSAEKVSTPAKRDRLAAISTIIPFLPSDCLHFIPAILSEVIISCKEVNERTRTTAFDLLVLMGSRIQSLSGNIIHNNKIAHMPEDATSVTASLEEYFTMVSAGLAGTTPHMVSATITALTRILYHFRDALREETLADLVQTMDLFLTSNNREIVRSVLGFVKVCVLSLPTALMQPRLPTLVPNLMVWSREHKAHFKAKVKHILERMIKRFGVETVNKLCPEEDRKLIVNIRKTKDRNKRHREEAKAIGSGDKHEGKRKGRFESEYDEAVYGSDDSASNGSDLSDDEVLGCNKKVNSGGKTYITEDPDEPLDLLDRKALASISSTRPSKERKRALGKAKLNEDGKLIIGDSNGDEDKMVLDTPASTKGQGEGGGVDAYVSALKSRDAARRGRGGRLKFSNRKAKINEGDDGDEDGEEAIIDAVRKKLDSMGNKPGGKDRNSNPKGSKPMNGRGGGQLDSRSNQMKSGKGGIARGSGRKGLGVDKRRGESGVPGRRDGRVMKSFRGRRGGRR